MRACAQHAGCRLQVFYQEAFEELGKDQVYFVFADDVHLARKMMAPIKAAGYQVRFIEENVIMSLRREFLRSFLGCFRRSGPACGDNVCVCNKHMGLILFVPGEATHL